MLARGAAPRQRRRPPDASSDGACSLRHARRFQDGRTIPPGIKTSTHANPAATLVLSWPALIPLMLLWLRAAGLVGQAIALGCAVFALVVLRATATVSDALPAPSIGPSRSPEPARSSPSSRRPARSPCCRRRWPTTRAGQSPTWSAPRSGSRHRPDRCRARHPVQRHCASAGIGVPRPRHAAPRLHHLAVRDRGLGQPRDGPNRRPGLAPDRHRAPSGGRRHLGGRPCVRCAARAARGRLRCGWLARPLLRGCGGGGRGHRSHRRHPFPRLRRLTRRRHRHLVWGHGPGEDCPLRGTARDGCPESPLLMAASL
jgi:hypothetical protein